MSCGSCCAETICSGSLLWRESRYNTFIKQRKFVDHVSGYTNDSFGKLFIILDEHRVYKMESLIHDDWDPMSEDFYDPSFNAYLDGPGARLDPKLQPWARMKRNKGPYKLHISNIPVQITKEGLTNIFCRYGDILSVYKHEQVPLGIPVTWGIVVFARHSQAELAIRELNGRKPYYLKVQFAMSEAEKERQRLERERMAMWETAKAAEALVQPDRLLMEAPLKRKSGIGCGRGTFTAQYLNNLPPMHHPRDFEDDYSDEDIFDPFGETNRLMMDSVHYSAQSGSTGRKVYMGRGHTSISAHIPGKRNPVHGNYSSDEDYNADHGRYVYGNPVHLEAGVVGPCQLCSRMTSMMCKKCGDYYCSAECQKKDWPNHKPFCIEAPGVVSRLSDGILAESKNDSSSTPKSPSLRKDMSELTIDTKLKDACTTTESNNLATEKDCQSENYIRDNSLNRNRNSTATSARYSDRSRESGENSRLSTPNQNVCTGVDEHGSQNFLSARKGETRRKEQENGNTYDHKYSGNDSLLNNSSNSTNPPSIDDFNRSKNLTSQDNSGKKGNDNRRKNAYDSSRNQDLSSSSADRSGTGSNYNSQNHNSWGGSSSDRRNVNSSNYYSQNQNADRKSGTGSNWNSQNQNADRKSGTGSNWNSQNQNSWGSSSASRKSGTGRNWNSSQNTPRSHFRDDSRQQHQGNRDSRRDGKDFNYGDRNHQNSNSKQKYQQGGEMYPIDRNSTGTPTSQKKPILSQESSSTFGPMHYKKDEDVWEAKQTADYHQTTKATAEVIKSDLGSDTTVITTKKESARSNETPQARSLLLEQLGEDTFTDVKVALKIGSFEYWVQKTENEMQLLKTMKLLQDTGNEETCVPKEGTLCSALYDGMWYRARIVEVIPNIKVHYIDYGNEEICTADSIRTMPASAFSLPAQAIKIKLAEGTSDQYKNLPEDSTLRVKPFKTEVCGSVIVMIEGENYSALLGAVCTKPSVKDGNENVENVISVAGCVKTSVLNLLAAGLDGAIHVRSLESPSQFSGAVVASSFLEMYRKVHGDLCSYFENETDVMSFKPKVGDFVAAELPSDSQWHRAYVLSHTSAGYRVAFSDLGICKTVQNIRKLPEEYHLIEEMAVRCRVTEYVMTKDTVWGKYLKVDAQLKLKFIQSSADKVVASVLDDEETVCIVEISRWVPVVAEGLQSVSLESNSIVVLSSFLSSKTMFVRPLDRESVEKFNSIIQDVAGHCYEAPRLEDFPLRGEVVACKYSCDGNYYRAKVHSFEKDKIRVFFMDFGNYELEELRNMKCLSDKLKLIPASVVKVQLKDVPELPLNKDVTHFLSEITLKEKEIKIIFANLKLGVDMYVDGTHVNAEIKSMLEPSWKENEDKSKIINDEQLYFYDDLKFVEYSVGETVDLRICYIEAPNIAYGFKEGSDVMQYVMTKLQADMNEYCNNVNKESFLPRKYEICLAKYEDSWYRAACLETVNSNLVSVLFIDFGNKEVVPNDVVRKMIPDFMQTPVAIATCRVTDFSVDDPDSLQKLLPFMEKLQRVKILKVEKKGLYEITLLQE